ncbi:MAG: hypothetical protein LUF90_03465 [Rikenellaceae bacterium]|nr:hypothetical protein [Rikenellaceae bacterium]
MESKEFIDDIVTASGGAVIKKKNPRFTVISVVILFISVVLFAVGSTFDESGSFISILLVTFGCIGLITESAGAFIGKYHYVYTVTNKEIDIESFNFGVETLTELTTIQKSSDFGKIDPKELNKASGIKWQVWISRDNKFAATQLYQYRPHSYYPVSPIKRVLPKDTPQLRRLVKG